MAQGVNPETDFVVPELTWNANEVPIKATGEDDPAVVALERERQLARDRNYVVKKSVAEISRDSKSIKPPKNVDAPIQARELRVPDPKNNSSDKDHPWYEQTSDRPN